MAGGFSNDAVVVVKQLNDTDWALREGFTYQGQQDVFEVKIGDQTDFASVPRVFVWFLPRYGAYTLAAVLHDHLWRDLASKGKLDYVDADGTFRRAMRELNVPFLTRWIMWSAVRWGALRKPGGKKNWLKEAPRVALFTLITLPIIVPPAILILVAIGLFLILEALVWVPLKISYLLRRNVRGGVAPEKQVNAPKVAWKL